MGRPERIGIFGGTFDPPHVGHLVVAVNVRHALDLDKVLLVVANVPWQKAGTRQVSPAPHRMEMVVAAANHTDGLEPSDLEIRRGGNSYTADTLHTLLDENPNRELFVIVGEDAAVGLDTWERIDEVRELATIVVVDRPTEVNEFVEMEDGPKAALPPAVQFIDSMMRVEAPRLEVSSSDLRARITDGRPLEFLVPDAVIDCIRRLGLYRVHE